MILQSLGYEETFHLWNISNLQGCLWVTCRPFGQNKELYILHPCLHTTFFLSKKYNSYSTIPFHKLQPIMFWLLKYDPMWVFGSHLTQSQSQHPILTTYLIFVKGNTHHPDRCVCHENHHGRHCLYGNGYLWPPVGRINAASSPWHRLLRDH